MDRSLQDTDQVMTRLPIHYMATLQQSILNCLDTRICGHQLLRGSSGCLPDILRHPLSVHRYNQQLLLQIPQRVKVIVDHIGNFIEDKEGFKQ
jgi:hypothetical protein